jgi:hypothetical protein
MHGPTRLVDEIIITVKNFKMKRTTSWGISCNACTGTDLSKNINMARSDAVRHAREKHKGRAQIREVRR